MLAFDKLNKTSVWYKQTGPKSIQPITNHIYVLLAKKKNLNQIALLLELGFSISVFFLLTLFLSFFFFLYSFFQFFIEVKNDI